LIDWLFLNKFKNKKNACNNKVSLICGQLLKMTVILTFRHWFPGGSVFLNNINTKSTTNCYW